MSDNYASVILADEPVGYWRLNEVSHADPVCDESGSGHHGRFVGLPTLGVEGAILADTNRSMTFGGGAHIEIPHSADFSIQTSGKGLSVEVWMRPDQLTFPSENEEHYIHWLGKGRKKSGTTPAAMEWGFRFYSGSSPNRPNRLSAYAWNPQGGLGAGAYFQQEFHEPPGWMHLVACFDHYLGPCNGKTGVTLYVNGKVRQTPPSRGTLYLNEGNWSVNPRTGDAPLRIGTCCPVPNSFLTGGLDEVTIYPNVLTASQVCRHYAAGISQLHQ